MEILDDLEIDESDSVLKIGVTHWHTYVSQSSRHVSHCTVF